MESRTIARALGPIRLVGFGCALAIFDFRVGFISASGPQTFDLLNDSLGMLLILIGVVRLGEIKVDPIYEGLMAVLMGIAFVWLVGSVVKQLAPAVTERFSSAFPILSVIGSATILTFCFAMRRLCLAAELAEVGRNWAVTLVLFGVFYTFPLTTLMLVSEFRPSTSAGIPLSPAIFLAVLAAIPIVHGFYSIGRMSAALPRPPRSRSIGGTE